MRVFVEFDVEAESEDAVEDLRLEDYAHEAAYTLGFEPDHTEFDVDNIEKEE